ncbi:hypothetical protein [Actinoplanes solisilvae]|uniref:hypothetical protein n=1 Tax=Actinoplanes solisilvae TaxID=2486853 RepID=UPI000FD8AB3D|nr:hypothetical protein [Actinoplanes solisilvae]
MNRIAQQLETGQRLFRLLMTIADRLPHDLVTGLRTRPADGHEAEVAQAIVFAAVAGPVPLTEADIDLLITTIARAGEDTTVAHVVEQCRFAPPA